MSKNPTDPAYPVQMQLEAYNARDIDTFMPWWADDCQYYVFPDQLVAGTAEEIRERHVERFKEPNLHGKLLHRLVMGNTVIDHETVIRTFPEGPGELDVICIYEIISGKIAKAWFKIGDKRVYG
ncbi:putative hydrolase of HD superfamily [Rhizobium skierniewicense]|uniref:Putative hydrolase of HD superfamily n=1 Tax=Rhizobium skierniewicense TaxID=984260 RepID=A0A7W6C347_9HYPH|nr:nuclear transport factor 2 family protein [Rhizobium skierniewicense]MBB3944858.1 putative hydrolase of HD superfamily [Rhizobium skierniewicense]